MNKVILYIAASLDGFIAGDDDDISWLDENNEIESDEDEEYKEVDYGSNEFFSTIGARIEGRRTYEVEKKLGWEKTLQVPTFVLSHRRPKEEPDRSNIIFTNEDIGKVLEKAKRLTKKDIWIVGGGSVVHQFLDRSLIDEIRLTLVPIILGTGIRLFEGQSKQIALSITNFKQFGKGLIEISYEMIKASSSPVR